MLGAMIAPRCTCVLVLLAATLPAQAPAQPADGLLEGRVLGPLGEPMVGIEVRAVCWPDVATTTGRTRTDGEGMFVLGHLPRRTAWVFATSPGHTVGFEVGRLSAERAADAVTMRLWPANTLRGRVVDADGDPVVGAEVLGTKDFTWFEGGFRVPECTTGADGRFELPGAPIGDCVLRAWAPGFVLRDSIV